MQRDVISLSSRAVSGSDTVLNEVFNLDQFLGITGKLPVQLIDTVGEDVP